MLTSGPADPTSVPTSSPPITSTPIRKSRVLDPKDSADTGPRGARGQDLSSQTGPASSPQLPRLPTSNFGFRGASVDSPEEHRRTDSSVYYTASWGSPYQKPPVSSSFSPDSTPDESGRVSRSLEDHPIRLLGFDHLLASDESLFPEVLPPSSSDDISRPVQQQSRDWSKKPFPIQPDERVKKYLSNHTLSEKSNWWSDESAEGDGLSSSKGPTNPLEGSGSTWLDIDDDYIGEDPKTPTLQNSVIRKTSAGGRFDRAAGVRRHKSHKSNETLKQADFWKLFHDKIDSPSRSNTMFASRYADSPPPMATNESIAQEQESLSQEPIARSPSPVMEKPLPPPPNQRTASEYPAKSYPDEASPKLLPTKAEALPKGTSTSPTKRRILIQKKYWVIALPPDDLRGEDGGPPEPLTAEDMKRKLQAWEDRGYDTRGFGQWSSGPDDPLAELHGQNKAVYPDTQAMWSEWKRGNYRVSIPDRREWEDHMREINEEKLRALGVSMGEDDPFPSKSPAPSTMSRQASSQYPPLPFSPPIPTSSVASISTQHPNPFSPTFMPAGSTNPSSQVGSIASPVSAPNMHGNFHHPRQSVSVAGPEGYFGSPFQYPLHQGTPPLHGVWSPQQMLNQQGLARGGSPAVLGNVHNMGTILSPGSPFDSQAQNDVASHIRQQQLQNQLLQQQIQAHQQMISARQSPRLENVRESEEEHQSSMPPSKLQQNIGNVEIVTPVPRGHRHNVSESLQKEIDDAEYDLEGSINKQLKEAAAKSDNTSAWKFPKSEDDETGLKHENTASVESDHLEGSRELDLAKDTKDHTTEADAVEESKIAKDAPPVSTPKVEAALLSLSLTRQRTESVDHASSQGQDDFNEETQTNPSEIDTNPSFPASPDQRAFSKGHGHTLSTASNPWQDVKVNAVQADGALSGSHRGHGSRSSLSKLNVDAKEFKFDPSTTFKPGNFSFSGNNFQPSQPKTTTSIQNESPTHANNLSTTSFGSAGSKLNVTAPAFNPMTLNSTVPSSNFDFSAAHPRFHPNAPAFTPSKTLTESSATETNQNTPEAPAVPKIFKFAEIVKPTKKSKAIPIIRPDETTNASNEDEPEFDIDGRPKQPEGRMKRVRQGKADDDDVPQFAVPSQPLNETAQPSQVQKEPPKPQDQPLADKEHAAPIEESAKSPEAISIKPPIGPTRRSFQDGSPDYDGRGYPAWEFAENDEARDFSLAKPTSPFRSKSPQLYNGDDSDADMNELSAQQAELAAATADMEAAGLLRGSATPSESGRKQNLSSSLSASAKPFEFKPVAAPESTGLKPKPASPLSFSGANAGLGASRFAASPSPSIMPQNESAKEPSKVNASTEAPKEAVQSKDLPPQVVDYAQTSYLDIDAVMKQLNENDSDLGVERNGHAWKPESLDRGNLPVLGQPTPAHRLQPDQHLRSDAPSPSPRRFELLHRGLPGDRNIDKLTIEHPSSIDANVSQAFDSPIRRLNTPGDIPGSDWDDVMSSGEEAKLHPRSQFFDGHVNDLVGGLLERRLGPLESALSTIQQSLAILTTNATRPRSVQRGVIKDSDADDEDDVDDGFQSRPKSPRKDKKLEKIKAIVMEAIATSQPAPQPQPANIKSVVEEAIAKREAAKAQQGPPHDQLQLRISALESMLKEAEVRAEDEAKSRHTAEDKLAEALRLLKLSQVEEARHKEASEEKEKKLRALDDKGHHKIVSNQMRSQLLDAAQGNLQKSVDDLKAKNAALEGSLREARTVGEKTKNGLEKADDENKELRRTLDIMRSRMEESTRIRDGLDGKFDRLQDGIAAAERDLAQERDAGRKREGEYTNRYEIQSARLEAEARTRERLERELERLENQELEAMKARFMVENVQKSHSNLENIVNTLRQQNSEHQDRAAKFERDFGIARETSKDEIQRLRILMQVEIDAATQQLSTTKASSDSQLEKARLDAQHFRNEADNTREQLESLRLEMKNTRTAASKEIPAMKQAIVQEEARKHKSSVESIRSQHERELRNALEDGQRLEQHLAERLSLSNAKTDHLQDKVIHLEEKLEIARSAAHAAAQAAQKAGSTEPTATRQVISKAMEPPEKISPQALRESIMVLQEQLQEREGRIEKLEQELSTVDLDAPNKIRDRDTEIGWLRELLGVRIADLEDIVKNLEEATYDGEAVKDAAIRLKANLQMEQQERERAMAGGMTFPSLSSIRNFSSPKAVLPLAAAWGSWRKATDTSLASLSDMATGIGPTPSKSSPSATSFLSGLMTPPSTNQRQTASPESRPHTPRGSGVAGRARTVSEQISARQGEKAPSQRMAPPTTPPLLRKSSYDQDAESRSLGGRGARGFFDDDASTINGHALDEKAGQEEPFGPSIGSSS
jgi:DNA repair exonuclease SbcCD ATPase subunit